MIGWQSITLIDNTPYAWGSNNYGQLGDGSTTNRTTPTKIGSLKFTQVSVGGEHSLGITTDGSLYAWGSNNYGQLGDGSTTNRTTPTKIGSLKFTQVSAGEEHSLGITTDGLLYVWGGNGFGKLGDGSTTKRTTPTKIGSLKFTQVSAGEEHSLGITTDGSLYAWGSNNYGQLGDGSTTNRTTPTKIGSLKFTQVSAGSSHSFGITTDGSLYAWGYNGHGRLGDGSTTNRTTPTKIGSLKFTQVSAGGDHSLGITTDGSLYAWGYNNYGQLGDGTTTNRSVPTKILDRATALSDAIIRAITDDYLYISNNTSSTCYSIKDGALVTLPNVDVEVLRLYGIPTKDAALDMVVTINKLLHVTVTDSVITHTTEQVEPFTLTEFFRDSLVITRVTNDDEASELALQPIVMRDPIAELPDEFDVVVKSDEPVTIAETFVPLPQLVIPTGDINIESIEFIKQVKLKHVTTGSGALKVIVSFDKGDNWYTYLDGRFVKINVTVEEVLARGMAPATLENITGEEWSELRYVHNTMRFAYVLDIQSLTDRAEADALTTLVDMKGTWKSLVHGRDYDYEYTDNETLSLSLYVGGDIKMNI